VIGVEAAIRIFGAGIDNVAPVSGKTEPVSPRLLDDDAQQVVLENVVTFAAAGQWALQQVVAAIGFARSVIARITAFLCGWKKCLYTFACSPVSCFAGRLLIRSRPWQRLAQTSLHTVILSRL
jgi:hypothetical protein